MKDCMDCVFFTHIPSGSTCGKCDYPVPAWISIRAPSGNFVTGIEANNCPTFKSRMDVIEEAKNETINTSKTHDDMPR